MLPRTEVPNLIFRRTDNHALKSQSSLKISNYNWKDLEEVVVSDAGSLGHVDPCSLQLQLRLAHQVRLKKKVGVHRCWQAIHKQF